MFTRTATSPERSLILRRWVFLASIPSLLALAWVGQLWIPALLTVLVLAGGHYYSWRAAPPDRREPFVRLGVFIALHLALCYMCAGFTAGILLPQAQFAMYAQAIISFDLRRRTNLYSYLGFSLLTLSVAAAPRRTPLPPPSPRRSPSTCPSRAGRPPRSSTRRCRSCSSTASTRRTRKAITTMASTPPAD